MREQGDGDAHVRVRDSTKKHPRRKAHISNDNYMRYTVAKDPCFFLRMVAFFSEIVPHGLKFVSEKYCASAGSLSSRANFWFLPLDGLPIVAPAAVVYTCAREIHEGQKQADGDTLCRHPPCFFSRFVWVPVLSNTQQCTLKKKKYE